VRRGGNQRSISRRIRSQSTWPFWLRRDCQIPNVSSQIKCERELAIREWCKFVMIRMHLRANRPKTIACRLLFDLFQEIQFASERAADMWPGSPEPIIASRNAVVVSRQIAEHFRATQLGVDR
jgi:hypothetical protein